MVRMINKALVKLVDSLDRQGGQALAEYGLIVALIAVAAIVALGFLGAAISGTLDDLTGAMP